MDQDGTSAAAASPDLLVRRVVQGFPREPLHIRGDFTLRRRRGVVMQEQPFEMTVHWGGDPMQARYAVLDEESGRPLEEMRLVRRRDAAPEWTYRHGIPLRQAEPPNLFESIRGTDVSWMDLSLSFLWWTGGRLVGEERIRGYPCHIVEIPAPQHEREANEGANRAYAKVRLWIDHENHMLLQAKGYDRDGEPIRRMWVRSLQKIDDRWMIKDMEVQQYPAVHRTKLTIREVDTPDDNAL